MCIQQPFASRQNTRYAAMYILWTKSESRNVWKMKMREKRQHSRLTLALALVRSQIAAGKTIAASYTLNWMLENCRQDRRRRLSFADRLLVFSVRRENQTLAYEPSRKRGQRSALTQSGRKRQRKKFINFSVFFNLFQSISFGNSLIIFISQFVLVANGFVIGESIRVAGRHTASQHKYVRTTKMPSSLCFDLYRSAIDYDIKAMSK